MQKATMRRFILMTLSEFSIKNNIKESTATIIKWIDSGYIPGAWYNHQTKESYLPPSARKPDTKANPNAKPYAIYKRMAWAIDKNYRPISQKYPNIDFNAYIRDLERSNLLSIRTDEDGYEYYDPTPLTHDYACGTKNEFIQFLISVGIGVIGLLPA